jgi:hypothetical protein
MLSAYYHAINMPAQTGFILINQVDICIYMHQKLAQWNFMHTFVAV